MKRRIQVAGREILCKDITHVGIEDENGYIQYYHRDDFTYIKDKRKGQLEEYCKKISKSLHDNKLIVIEMSPFRRLLLKNKKLHCVFTHAYVWGNIDSYYINGERLTEEQWKKHPMVISHNRRRKIEELYS